LLRKGAQSDIFVAKGAPSQIFLCGWCTVWIFGYAKGAASGIFCAKGTPLRFFFLQKVHSQNFCCAENAQPSFFFAQRVHRQDFFLLQEKKSCQSFFVSKKVHHQVLVLKKNKMLGFSSVSTQFFFPGWCCARFEGNLSGARQCCADVATSTRARVLQTVLVNIVTEILFWQCAFG